MYIKSDLWWVDLHTDAQADRSLSQLWGGVIKLKWQRTTHRDVETRNIREATQTVRFYWCRTRVQDFYLQQTPGEIYTYIQWQVDTGSRESKRRSRAGKRPHSSSHSTPQNRIHERGSLTLTLIQTRSTGTGNRQGSREVCTKEIMQRLKRARGNTGEPGLAQWSSDEPRSAEISNRPEVTTGHEQQVSNTGEDRGGNQSLTPPWRWGTSREARGHDTKVKMEL